jgi:hypothetical protein
MSNRPSRRGARRLSIAAIVALVGSLASPVLADCYDILGCTDKSAFSAHYDYLVAADGPTCDFLYVMRNQIYAQHGYCFKTARAVQEIGNTFAASRALFGWRPSNLALSQRVGA